MAKKVPRCVKTLTGFLRWAEQFNDGQYLFRGVREESYKIEAGASRRLPEGDRYNPAKLLKINQELIDKARLLGHDQLGGEQLSDLPLLAELQHFRAATCLIDFTRNALVALWFACEQISTTESEDKVEGTDGKVYAVRIDDPARFRTITSDLLEKDINDFFVEDENGRYPLYQWQPKLQNNRIIAQQSVFIFGGAKIEAADECIISRGAKGDLLKALDKLAGLTEATIYPDSDGFARLHVQNNPDFEPDSQGYLQRGIEVHQKGEREEAITYYTTVISPLPDETTQPPDKDILSWAHHHRGIAYLGENPNESAVDLAIDDFTKAIQLKTEIIESIIENPAKTRRLKRELARIYIYRGSARYWQKGDFDSAITDYTEATKLDPEYAEAYNYRGFAYLNNGDIDKTIADYTKAIDIDQELTEAYKDRATAYLANSDFGNAITDYTKAIQLDPDDTNIYNYRGLAHFRNSEIDKAIDDLSRAIQLKPDSPDAYYNRGIVQLGLQNWEEAKTDLTTAANNQLDVATEFQQEYGRVEDFERGMDIELPADIASILTGESASTNIL
ncbi:MAG: tetratricopeptide repeat protein [Candidatus Poribacteria bacterium]|nr:tetratricopeptide repeat protein [Candidatus Poribacteria bacterium]